MDASTYVQRLLSQKVENSDKYESKVFKEFSEIPEINESASEIIKLQSKIMEMWEVKSKILAFENLNIVIPNATQGKPYEYSFEPNFFKKSNIFHYYFIGLEDLGLDYDRENLCIKGNPTQSGNLKLNLKFLVEGESEHKEHHLKLINLVINPDPKSLWKNIESDKDAIYWKEDNKSSSAKLSDKYIIASSKRGRSHQNVGSFRDDDYAFKHFEDNGWTVVAVSDGAGSYPFSRKGSEMACKEIINFFSEKVTSEDWASLEQKLRSYKESEAASNDETSKAAIEDLMSDVNAEATSDVSSEVASPVSDEGSENAYSDLFEDVDSGEDETADVANASITSEVKIEVISDDEGPAEDVVADDSEEDTQTEKEEESTSLEDEKDKIFNDLNAFYKNLLYKGTLHVYTRIGELAGKTFKEHPDLMNHPKAKTAIDYFHSTFIFTIFKKFDFGYAILTFGVGDCPIGLVNTDESEAILLNWLDVGEFGGGTRFVTQREIFDSKERPMHTRINLHFEDDFSYLFLMTDGIYDAKFVVEANLEKTEKWKEFIADLKGNNEDKAAIEFGDDIKKAEGQLNEWMDFWSKGNHDDRTLAIIYKA